MPIGPLLHVERGALEIDIEPAQAAQFRGVQAGEHRGQQERPVAPGRGAMVVEGG